MELKWVHVFQRGTGSGRAGVMRGSRRMNVMSRAGGRRRERGRGGGRGGGSRVKGVLKLMLLLLTMRRGREFEVIREKQRLATLSLHTRSQRGAQKRCLQGGLLSQKRLSGFICLEPFFCLHQMRHVCVRVGCSSIRSGRRRRGRGRRGGEGGGR